MNLRQLPPLLLAAVTMQSYSAPVVANESAGFDLEQTILSTTIKSSEAKVEPHPLSHLIDGDASTYYWSGSELEKGETVTMTMNAPVPLGKRLKVTTGFGLKNKEDGDHLESAVLEASQDQGQSWKEVAKFHAGKAEVITSFLSRHYRVRVTERIPHWVAFRHLEVSDQALTQKTVKGTAVLNGKKIPLSITTDLEGFDSLKPRFDEMAKLYFEVWPKLVTWLGVPADQIPRDVDIFLVHSLPHPAHAMGHTMTIDSRHLLNHPKDTAGVFVHELGHIVQHYSKYEPGWFVEGSADYVRYRQFPNGKWANDRRRTMTNKKPKGYYWDSASFLLWMEDTYKRPVVALVSRAIHDGIYRDDLFKELTGKSLEELTKLYQESGYRPDLKSPRIR